MRLVIALLFVALAWLAFGSHHLSLAWLAVPVVAFGGIAVWHSRILRSRELADALPFISTSEGSRALKTAGQARAQLANASKIRTTFTPQIWICSAKPACSNCSRARAPAWEKKRWRDGCCRLRRSNEIRTRQEAVVELRDELDLREDLAVLGEDAGVGVHSEELVKWSESPNQMTRRWLAWLAPSLAVMAIAAAVVWAVWGIATPFVLIVAVEAGLTWWQRHPIDIALHGTEQAFHGLDLFSGVLERLESHRFRGAGLQALQRELLSSGATAFQAIAKLRSLVDFINSRHNIFVRIIDAPLMYSVQVAYAAERWRRRHGAVVRNWVTVIGEIEALLSLAAYSFEHPADPFPEFMEGAASFDGEQLGHPLLPAEGCVRNSATIGGATRVLLVSGSNMSGKSTLLRAIGINVVLAMAGGPVRAKRLRMTPLRVGASIRVNDSLQEGSSRFYAEITRLRQILDLAASAPSLLFLLDELLQGTNSNDRRVGGEGIVRAFVDRGAIGLVSTHDLAITNIGAALEGRVRNVHFQDELANGRMTFDYTLREGVVTKSNGLELMRSIGLDV